MFRTHIHSTTLIALLAVIHSAHSIWLLDWASGRAPTVASRTPRQGATGPGRFGDFTLEPHLQARVDEGRRRLEQLRADVDETPCWADANRLLVSEGCRNLDYVRG